MKSNSTLLRFGRFVFTYRKSIITFWIIFAMALSLLAVRLPSVLSGSGFTMDGSFTKTENILQDKFGRPKSSVIIVFDSSIHQPKDTVYKEYVKKTMDNLKKVQDAVEFQSPYDNSTLSMSKGNLSYATIGFDKGFDNVQPSLVEIKKKLKDENGMTAVLTGGPVIADDMNKASQQDLARAEAIGIPAALIILLLAFGSLAAASLPIIIGVMSVACSLGLLYLFRGDAGLSIFLLNVVPMIGLALGIDFALLLVNRFREELIKGTETAVIISIATAGRSIAFSGLCVFLGLSGMLLIDIDIFKTVALGGMVVVVLSVIAAVTFLPALLGVIGEKINAFTVFKAAKSSKSVWHNFAAFVMKRPVIMATLAILVLSAALIPIFRLTLSIPEAEALPKHYESRIAFERFEESFGKKELYPVTFVLQTEKPFLKDEEALNQLNELHSRIKEERIVSRTESIFSFAENPGTLLSAYQIPESRKQLEPAVQQFISGDTALFYVYLNVNITGREAQQFVREWEEDYGDLKVTVGGVSKFNQEIFDEIIQKMPYGLAVVLMTTFFILMAAFRSLFIPIKAILMNILSLSATFGILVYIFQSGHIYEPADIALMIPVFTFGIVFGLSMDYEVFLISRIQEVYAETGDNDQATLIGLTSTSKIITSAAAIMIVITGSFAFTDVMPVKQIGIAIALAILLDATVVRMVLVPSLMKLLGDYNWYLPFAKNKRIPVSQHRKGK
ncbi:MMPL family transporter [Fictibacillus iocasae]|uniref:MMPL family transporter n=1 Tax=Fictibacillus iocasae TaxID=2715437 RepID=A0ABW2NMM6_9BACL